jgi:hypothetical protein
MSRRERNGYLMNKPPQGKIEPYSESDNMAFLDPA